MVEENRCDSQILSEKPRLLTMHLAALRIRVQAGCKELNENL